MVSLLKRKHYESTALSLCSTVTKQGWSSGAGAESLTTRDVSRLLWTICRDLIILGQTN